jgi:hypothetical protein
MKRWVSRECGIYTYTHRYRQNQAISRIQRCIIAPFEGLSEGARRSIRRMRLNRKRAMNGLMSMTMDSLLSLKVIRTSGGRRANQSQQLTHFHHFSVFAADTRHIARPRSFKLDDGLRRFDIAKNGTNIDELPFLEKPEREKEQKRQKDKTSKGQKPKNAKNQKK